MFLPLQFTIAVSEGKDSWQSAQVSLEPTSPGFTILFDAIPYSNCDCNLIGLDSIRLLEGGYCNPAGCKSERSHSRRGTSRSVRKRNASKILSN